MTDLSAAVDSYLAMRRSLGFKLVDAGSLLPDFARYLHNHGAQHVSTELALAWSAPPVNAAPLWWRQRLGIVRGFAEYLHNIDPDTEVPPRDLLPARQQRVAPYLVLRRRHRGTDGGGPVPEPAAACRHLRDVHRVAFSHRSTTRRGSGSGSRRPRQEATTAGVRHAKRGGRKVPLHETTLRALQRYFDHVDRCFPEPVSPSVFVSIRGTRMNKDSIHATFPVLIDRAGLTGRGQRPRPRIHDLRHSMAVRQLMDWHQQRVDVDARIPLLSAVLGHSNPASTYWYLQAAPELFAIVGRRLEEFLGELP